MDQSLKRFSRGFLGGSLVGSALLAFGLVAWLVAQLLGVDKDDSMHGMSLLPMYVLVFGLGGGVIKSLEADRVLSLRSFLAWMLAIAVVLGGCFFIASFVISQQPVDWIWGISSGTAWLFLVAWSLAVWRTTTKRGIAEPVAAPDDGRT
jgi:hypothetical protein